MKTAYIIGRFQPFHTGHESIAVKAYEDGIRNITFLIGSANRSPSIKNPFSYEERVQIIENKLHFLIENGVNIRFEPVNDFMYNDTLWIREVYSKIENPASSMIYGHSKDFSSDYLNWFPGVKLVDVDGYSESVAKKVLSATDIRKEIFEGIIEAGFKKEAAEMWCRVNGLKCNSEHLVDLAKEYEFVKNYKKQFEALPYPPTFVTTDAVVIQSGHVLLVKRGELPGKGLWALPGGFLNAASDRYLVDCAIRELYEETDVKLPEKVVRASVVESKAFDEVGRSTRGRTITHAFYIKLDDSKPLPKVKGSDDAAEAKWVRLSDLNPCELYEDHWDIIAHFMVK